MKMIVYRKIYDTATVVDSANEQGNIISPLIKNKVAITVKIFWLAHGNDILVNKNIIKRKRIRKTFSAISYIIANSYFKKRKLQI